MNTSLAVVAVFECGLHLRRQQNSHLVMVVVQILQGDWDFIRKSRSFNSTPVAKKFRHRGLFMRRKQTEVHPGL